jgi:uncharacterized protein YjbI with pentapeptide repeats
MIDQTVAIATLLNGQPRPENARRVAELDCSVLNLANKTIVGGMFVGVNFKDSKFEQCNLSHSYFERCYFRRAAMHNTNLVGCRFKDCAFQGASFSLCDLSYAEFDNCDVLFRQIENCLPRFQNVLHEFAGSLRMNAQRRGDGLEYRLFLQKEIEASELHN